MGHSSCGRVYLKSRTHRFIRKHTGSNYKHLNRIAKYHLIRYDSFKYFIRTHNTKPKYKNINRDTIRKWRVISYVKL